MDTASTFSRTRLFFARFLAAGRPEALRGRAAAPGPLAGAFERIGAALRARWVAVLVGLWVLVIGAGLAALGAYSLRAGDPGTPAARWPAASALAADPQFSTLVLIAHPRCPCTRASLGELERLLAQSGGRLRAHVLFVEPEAMAEGWSQTDLWRTAARIPGVSVHRDLAGTQARLFGCETSGHALLYDREGRLRFQGGITAARGHAGDNPGSSAVLERLADGSLKDAQSAVFGCGLFSREASVRFAVCKP